MKTQTFSEAYGDMKTEAVQKLEIELRHQRRWKILAELMLYKEELNIAKNAQKAAIGGIK